MDGGRCPTGECECGCECELDACIWAGENGGLDVELEPDGVLGMWKGPGGAAGPPKSEPLPPALGTPLVCEADVG